ncbi:MAG: hypothetical protein KR126chlam5_00734 [Candidatus Anoxychlamydiales bacterium]|nr:hypothetical protein [Candidatus Anoxychlamydiales bacterium]
MKRSINIKNKRKPSKKNTKKFHKKIKTKRKVKTDKKTNKKSIRKKKKKLKEEPLKRKSSKKNIKKSKIKLNKKTKINSKKENKKRKTFNFSTILIVIAIFSFFLTSNFLYKRQKNKVYQEESSLIIEDDEPLIQLSQSEVEEIFDENKPLLEQIQDQLVDVEDSLIESSESETLDSLEAADLLIEEVQNEISEKIDLNESNRPETQDENQNILFNMIEPSKSLSEKADDEIVKMIEESSFNPAKLQIELINFLNKYLINGSYQLKPILDQSQSIISKNEVQKDLNIEEVKISQDSYCSKCQSQKRLLGKLRIEESKNRSYMQGQQICRDDLPIGYNAPGRIDVCGGIKSYIIADFIYFEELENQLDLGAINITSPTPQEFEILKFKTGYQPGFKVGVGAYFKRNDWDLFAQYTRLHKTKNTLFDPSGKTGTFNTSWFYTNVSQLPLSTITSDIKSTWKVDLDRIDLELGRSNYLGSSLITRPFISLSSHRLDQRYDLSLTTTQLYSSSTKNDSWSIGPRIGFSTSWFFYKEFNLFGQVALSLLFAENEISGSGDENLITYNLKKVDKYILRDVEELKIGFGWGAYFTSNKWHFNLSLAYEAQRYSHSNYMSYVSQINLEANEVNPGDLFLHGLTIAARFEF